MLGIHEPEVTNGVEPVRLFYVVVKLTEKLGYKPRPSTKCRAAFISPQRARE